MDLGVRGKNFVLVGGTTGMGFAAAQVLASEGANVALLARDPDRTRAKAVQLADEHGVKAVGIPVDAAQPGEGVERAVSDATAALGPLRGLAVTAGPMNRQGIFDEHDEASWEWYFQVILMITVRACRAIVPPPRGSRCLHDGSGHQHRRWHGFLTGGRRGPGVHSGSGQ